VSRTAKKSANGKIAPSAAAAPAISTPAGSGQAPAKVVEQPMVTPAPKATDQLTRGGQSAGRPGQIVTAANRWRENYNPLRGLTMRRAVELFELGQRGDTAYLQWTYRFIERRNPTLSGLLSRCEAPLTSFDWSIKTKSTLPPGATPEMAEAQQVALTDAYSNIDNLREALVHLHLADFRGYAHLQKHRDAAGAVTHLEPLNQWCVCRDGLEGNWFWNPDSRSTSQPLQFLGLPYCIGSDNLPLADFIIRECPRPVDEVGLIDTVRRGLCEKDWDGFIEIYGIPGGVVIMPSEVPQGKESEYEATAKNIAEGASGALPYGSDYKANTGPRNVDPFTPRIAHLDESLVLAGTGGKLAMLTEKTQGSRGNSKVHDKTFGEIANGRAKSCAECFIMQFDTEVLAKRFPGQPVCVYFDFGAEEEEDINDLCNNVASLKEAGKNVETDWLAEMTGYEFGPDDQATAPTEIDPETGLPVPPKAPTSKLQAPEKNQTPSSKLTNPATKVANRAGLLDDQGMAATLHGILLPLLKRLQAIAAIADPVMQLHMLQKLMEDEPQIARAILADNSLAKKLSPELEQQMIAVLTAGSSHTGAKPIRTK
jgi:phage gp29-like protein